MPRLLIAPVMALAIVSAAAQSTGTTASTAIPPVERFERHFAEGAGFLTSLPEGTRVDVKRADGSRFALELHGGKLGGKLPPAKLSADKRQYTSPVGYKLYLREESPVGFTVEAPNGNWTSFGVYGKKNLLVSTRLKKVWSRQMPSPCVLRLPDGTRVDSTDMGETWEALTLAGERFRFDPKKREWSSLPPVPSPPLIPDMESFYVSVDGETWRLPGPEDHVVFSWNWYPIGFEIAKALDDVRQPPRFSDLKRVFDELAQPQPPVDMAGYLLGRRLALDGGDQLTFTVPGQEPKVAFLLPGPIDPDYFELKQVLSLRHAFEPKRAKTP